jgi:hypothetical protein
VKFFKKILLSEPIIFVVGLVLLVTGFFLIFAGVFAITYYIDISFSILLVGVITYLITMLKRFRKDKLTETAWKVESKYIFLGGITVSILTIANYWLGFLEAPIILFIYGFYLIVLVYLGSEESLKKLSRKNHSDSTNQISGSELIPRTILNYSAILLLICGYWYFQIQNNESNLKQEGYAIANQLSELRYCQEYQQNCVAIDSVKGVTFKKIPAVDGPGKVWEMCFSMSFEYSRYDGLYESDYRYKDYCINNEFYGNGWPQSDLESAIYNKLKREING